jgi:hypothetical protein
LQLAFDLYADYTRLRTRQREKALRYWRDGEAIRRLFRGRPGRLPAVRWVEPEAVKAPPPYVGDRRCTFGVLCPGDDEQNHLGLWVCDPRNPADGEAVRLAGADPGEFRGLCEDLGLPVGPGVCVALKHGTDAAVKRGLPLLFSSEAMLRAARALLKNVLETAKEQARIAWLARHVGATQEAVADFTAGMAGQSGVLVPQVRAGSLVPTPAPMYGPGPREIRTNEHTTYAPGPVTPGTPNFLAAEQAALRSAAARVGMPEYMISASAEQANYASTKEAGSPFVTAREADLAVFAEDDRTEAREVLRLACESGAVPGRADDLDCEVSPPPVAIRSELEAEQVASLRMRDRVLSPQQRIRHAGGDPKHVVADWQAWPLAQPPIAASPPGEAAISDRGGR